MGRVPDSLMYNKGQHALNNSRSTMIGNQEKALTGKRINRPSEDPPSTIQAIQIKTAQDRDATVSQNLEVANSFLALTDGALGELTEVISRAKELAIQMSSTTNQTPDAREAVSKEAAQLGLRAVQLGNSRMGDRYIFAGYQMTRAPFDAEGNYFGDMGAFELEMDRGQKLAINVPGVHPFFGVTEITSGAQGTRQDPLKDAEPTISGEIRDPASIPAENRNIDQLEQPEAYAELQKSSGVNLFQAFKSFEKGLITGDVTLLNNAVEEFDSGFKQVLASRAMIGARQNTLALALSSIESSKSVNAELRSKAEDADAMQVYSDLAKNEHMLNATLEVNKKLLTPSLLDFLK